jgi:predicted XRE-type DNA-binding protein
VADLLLVKSEMLAEVATLIEDQGLSQVKAAERLGVDQPTLSKALNGKLTSVSVDRIFEWLNKLGCAVRIDTVKMSAGKKRGVYIEHRAHN